MSMTQGEIDFVLERFDQTEPALQRQITAELARRWQEAEQRLAKAEETAMASAHLIVEAGIVPGVNVDCRCDECRLVAAKMDAAGYLRRVTDRWWESDSVS